MAVIVILFEIFLERSYFCDKALQLQPTSWSASEKAYSPNQAHGSWGVRLEMDGERPTLPPNYVNLQSMLVALALCTEEVNGWKEGNKY